MHVKEYIDYDGLGIAKLIRDKEITQNEAIACALRAAELLNPEINTIIEIFPEALAGNESTDAPFYGVPFLIKDLALHAEGVLNEMGSRLTQGLRPPHDTDLMRRFREAGLRTIGRASTPEFGYCPTTEPIVNGPSRNPWNLDRMPGGSSGATAASVAAGIVPLAHANDGGGSIRIPAACCGLLGLKPTRGRVPNGPDMAEPLSGLAIEFAVTRTVRDAAHLLDAQADAFLGDIDIQHLGLDHVALGVGLHGLFAGFVPIDVGHVDHAVQLKGQADEQTEFGDVLNLALNFAADGVGCNELFPRIFHALFQPKADPTPFWIHVQHHHFDLL